MTEDKTTALATRDTVSLDVADFASRMEFEKQRLALMKEFVQGQMTVGVHYGKIPGTPGKMTLLKPGAELLTNIHGLHPEFEETERVSDRKGFKEYRDKYGKDYTREGFVKYSYRCSLMKSGQKVGEGVGTCNNWERKYLPVDMDDAENTVMKMAKKRAFIDAVLTATRTSDFFTQDMEERQPEEHPEVPDQPQSEAPQEEPRRTNQEAPRARPTSDDVISEPQRRRLYAISRAAQAAKGWSDQERKDKIDSFLRGWGYDSDTEIKRADYNRICTEVESWR